MTETTAVEVRLGMLASDGLAVVPLTCSIGMAIYPSARRMLHAVKGMITASQWFMVTPLPDDAWEVCVKAENAERLRQF